MPFDAQILLLLLKAKSPKFIDEFFVDTFRYRQDGVSEKKRTEWKDALGISDEEVRKLYDAVDQVIRQCLYLGLEKDDIAGNAVFPPNFHTNLKALLAKIIASHLVEWREASMNNMVSPPKLIDFDWRVDLKKSSNHLSRMAVPTLFVEMKVQETPEEKEVMPGVKDVQFELSKEALATMLDGLGKIRDQLGSIKS